MEIERPARGGQRNARDHPLAFKRCTHQRRNCLDSCDLALTYFGKWEVLTRAKVTGDLCSANIMIGSTLYGSPAITTFPSNGPSRGYAKKIMCVPAYGRWSAR